MPLTFHTKELKSKTHLINYYPVQPTAGGKKNNQCVLLMHRCRQKHNAGTSVGRSTLSVCLHLPNTIWAPLTKSSKHHETQKFCTASPHLPRNGYQELYCIIVGRLVNSWGPKALHYNSLLAILGTHEASLVVHLTGEIYWQRVAPSQQNQLESISLSSKGVLQIFERWGCMRGLFKVKMSFCPELSLSLPVCAPRKLLYFEFWWLKQSVPW